jgi:hypothetical protein
MKEESVKSDYVQTPITIVNKAVELYESRQISTVLTRMLS